MRLSSISDVHISPNFPERMEMFHRFCKSKIVKDSHIIVLLGDIFDHMAGQKLQYLSQYKEYFELLTTILNDGKKLIIVEGNHDFHTDQIYMNAFKDCVGSENLKNYIHLKRDETFKFSNTILYIGHGDVLDFDNEAYKRWKSIYSSRPFEILLKNLIPYNLLESLGKNASNNSRERGKKTFDYNKSQEKYRQGFRLLAKNIDFDVAITGHTHIIDKYEYGEKTMLNNGFFPATRKFITIDLEKKTSELIKLEESLQ